MFPLDQVNIIKLLVHTSLAVRRGEGVLILSGTDEDFEIATLLAAEAKSAGAQVAITVIDPRRDVYHEPPSFIAESMKRADLVIAVIYDIFYTEAKKEALSAGARFASLEPLGEGRRRDLANLRFDKEDIDLCVERSKRLSEWVSQSKTAEVTSEAGTHLRMSLAGRQGVQLLPLCREPGSFCCLPDYAEVACAPVEETAEGILVCDGTVLVPPRQEWVAKGPITLKIERGRIDEISGGTGAEELAAILAEGDPRKRLLGEMGIGATHHTRELRGTRGDMSRLGTLHFGFGKNTMLGGRIDAKSHMDLMVTRPTLKLDGTILIERGKFILK
jgi:2,5-dihydroxypyridine 5,6-dioxygenase